MIARPDQSLQAFYSEIYRPTRLLGGSAKTHEKYQQVFRDFAKHLGRPPRVSDLDEQQVCSFLTVASARWAAASLNRVRGCLLALARLAVESHVLAEVPKIRKIREPRRLLTFWTPQQVAAILAAARQEHGRTGMIDGIASGPYMVAAISVMYWTGLRPGAVWGLWRADVDLVSRTLYVRWEVQKQRADQLLKLHPVCCEAIKAIWLPERKMLFPWSLHPSSRYNWLDRILQRAGVAHGRRDKFMRLRRTTANLTHANGGDATWQLGHSSDRITRTYYLMGGEIQAADAMPVPGEPPEDYSI